MGLVSKDPVYILPQVYFNVLNEHKKMLNLESSNISTMIDPWSAVHNTMVSKLDPNKNSVTLLDGRELTYKALVLAPGFDTHVDMIPGLREFDEGPEDNNVFVHCLDSKERVERNFYNGYHNRGGDMICYSPEFPYKGEGTDFYALYYESYLR